MINPEKCRFLREDGVCKIAPRPKFAISLGNRVLINLTPKVPSEAKLLDQAADGRRFYCAGAQGIPESRRIATQKACDQYKPLI